MEQWSLLVFPSRTLMLVHDAAPRKYFFVTVNTLYNAAWQDRQWWVGHLSSSGVRKELLWGKRSTAKWSMLGYRREEVAYAMSGQDRIIRVSTKCFGRLYFMDSQLVLLNSGNLTSVFETHTLVINWEWSSFPHNSKVKTTQSCSSISGKDSRLFQNSDQVQFQKR